LKRDPAAAASADRSPKRNKSEKKAKLDARKRDAAARRAATAQATLEDPQSASGASSPPAAATSELTTPASTSTRDLEFDFDRPGLGSDWNLTSPAWKLDKGRLCVQGAKNHPAWLKHKIPVNARIEFDASSSSPDGDIKIEVWGDGKSAAVTTSYTNASSYIVIFGGWKNSYHVLARIDEHAKDRAEVKINPGGNDLRAEPVAVDRSYHFKIERNDGRTVRWYVDDIEIINLADSTPLAGEGHEYLGFNNWETRVCFDNLQVVAL